MNSFSCSDVQSFIPAARRMHYYAGEKRMQESSEKYNFDESQISAKTEQNVREP